MEPRSVLGKEDSTVPSEIVAGVICGSHGSAGVGDIVSLGWCIFSISLRGHD